MNFISASYNMYHNSIDITTFDGYILRIDCNKAEDGLKTTAWTEHVLNALAIDNPLEYARLYLNNEMQIFIDAEDISQWAFTYIIFLKKYCHSWMLPQIQAAFAPIDKA